MIDHNAEHTVFQAKYPKMVDETFYLDVFNPVNAGFGDGKVQLTAVRTIVNDDGWFWG